MVDLVVGEMPLLPNSKESSMYPFPCPYSIEGAALLLLAMSVTASVNGEQPTASKPDSVATDVITWIDELGSPVAVQREAATSALIAAGPRVMPELRKAIAGDDREVRARAELIAQTLERNAIAHLKERGIFVNDRAGFATNVSIAKLHVEAEDMFQLTCLYRVGRVSMRECNIDDDLIAHVGRLVTLKSLSLIELEVTDAGLAHFSDLQALESISIVNCPISGSGLGSLAGIKLLTMIDISECPLRDDAVAAGLNALKRDTSVRRLGLISCALSDEVVPAICEVESVNELNLGGTRISDDGLATLAQCERLFALALERTSVTDAGIAHLAELPKLHTLRLGSRTKVTASGLSMLHDSKSLRAILLGKSPLFDIESVASLRKKLKGVRIHWLPPWYDPLEGIERPQ